jgi:hypothetical protein
LQKRFSGLKQKLLSQAPRDTRAGDNTEFLTGAIDNTRLGGC